MKKIITILNLLVILAITGCANVKSNISQPYTPATNHLSISIQKAHDVVVSAEHLNLLKSRITKGLNDNGVHVVSNSAHLVTLKINSYYMRHDAARLTVGIMAGCDNIDSTVTIADLRTSKILGSSQFTITECAAWGTASQVITKYADGIVSYLVDK